MTASLQPSAGRGLHFLDFTIRAWREGGTLQVIAHATPVGGMRRPVAVKLGRFDARRLRLHYQATWQETAELGRELARCLLPPEVWRLLAQSLRAAAELPGLGVRLRLCLAEDLIDLPWEYLYRPDVDAASAPRSGFLLMDERISLVREPPTLLAPGAPVSRQQRGAYVGALFDDGTDAWGVFSVEYMSLSKSLGKLADTVDMKCAVAGNAPAVDRLLARGCDLFHYSGHVQIEHGQARLVQTASRARLAAAEADMSDDALLSTVIEAEAERAAWCRVEDLAPRLKQAGTRFVMLNACNSGFWPVAQPFLQAGVACLVGVQGNVGALAALNFSEKVYRSLAVGLSVDEAVTWGRLHVQGEGRSALPSDWGRFMVYMPAQSSVLFPRTAGAQTDRRQRAARKARAVTVKDAEHASGIHDGASLQRMLSDVAARTVLILGRFTSERKAVLDDIKHQLAGLSHKYLPVIFDYDKPRERDLIEAIVGLAAVSRFVIADLSDPKSIPAELQAIVPMFPSLPIVPIIEETQREYPVSDHILRRQSVHLPVVRYRSRKHLAGILEEQVIAPAERLYARLAPPVLM